MYQPAASHQTLTCSYQDHTCTRSRLEGYKYCIRHILEDKNAPFKQCNYIYSNNGRRCIMPAPKTEKRDSGFCAEHTRKAQLVRQRSSRRHVPPPSTESLLLSLSHYSRSENHRATTEELPALRDASEDEDVSAVKDSEECPDVVTRALNPFAEIDATKVNSDGCRVLDYASESDSDLEVATFSGTWRGIDLDSSDAESIDGSLEDSCKCSTFRHAGVYTAEEVAQLTRDKLIRLQSLYIDQFRRLQQALKERRRKYLHALKKEKETLCNIHSQAKDSVREQKLYLKLKSLNRYKKLSGVEATLHKKSLERRALATEGVTVRQPPTSKCIFTEGGVKCGEKTLPMAKYCLKHILQDSHQVLFRGCGCTKAGFPCQEPVPTVFENASCVYHSSLPPAPSHLSASHVKAEDDAREQSASKSVAVRMVGTDKPKTSPLKKEATDGDPSESFNSETSTTDTASNVESLENVEC